MAKVAITEQYLTDIADAIRTKTGLSTQLYYPSEMAPAIMTISGSGGITPTGSISITENGTHNVTTYASANVSVPNSYSASDEGKVVSGGQLVTQGSATYNSNNTYDTTLISSVTVNVSGGGGSPTINSLSVTPSESVQTFNSSSVDGYKPVTVGAISDTYIGSAIDQRDSDDLTASGATVTVPEGYYAAAASKSVSAGTAGTPTATKGTVSSHSISVTPSVINTTGYITGGTVTGTAVSVNASELVSGTYSVAGSGTADVTNYASASVPAGTVVPASTISATAATITTGTGTITLTKTVSNTPNVSTAGYISAGTAGNSSISLTASVTINPTPTASGKTVTIPAGYYTTQTTKDVADASFRIGSVSLNGSTLTTGTNTIILTRTDGTLTPTVSQAGYFSGGSGSIPYDSITLTANVTTKAAATITPTTTNQTIASGTYLTGTQTIVGDADLVASNIIDGVQIFGVTGNVVLQSYYTGSSAPSSSLGSNGDLYLQS